MKTLIFRNVLVYLVLITFLPSTLEYQNWRHDRKPRLMGARIPLRSIVPYRRPNLQKKIVFFHNYFRSKVTPKAGNMLQMRWHKGAAGAAQKWSEECMFLTHDNVTGRHIHGYGACGQNIFVSTRKVPWLFAIKTWYLEKDNFTYGSRRNDIKVVGHYTQMVWATSHEVGCGLARCFRNGNVSGRKYYSYVCNYCPIGNREVHLGRPYRKGKPCSMCRNHCHAKKMCTNSCKVADLWANCKDLYRVWPKWLCHDRSTTKGAERAEHCKATCTCRNQIHG